MFRVDLLLESLSSQHTVLFFLDNNEDVGERRRKLELFSFFVGSI